jgi:hypothetical protein
MTDVVPLPQPDLIPGFLEVCPEFAGPWREHIAYWAPDRAGAYNDMGELARFVVNSYAGGSTDVVARALARVEQLLQSNDEQTNGLLVVGLLETIQTIASHHSFGGSAFVGFLGPISRRAWAEIERAWEGQSSLMDVIRAEGRGQ